MREKPSREFPSFAEQNRRIDDISLGRCEPFAQINHLSVLIDQTSREFQSREPEILFGGKAGEDREIEITEIADPKRCQWHRFLLNRCLVITRFAVVNRDLKSAVLEIDTRLNLHRRLRVFLTTAAAATPEGQQLIRKNYRCTTSNNDRREPCRRMLLLSDRFLPLARTISLAEQEGTEPILR